MPGVMTEWSPLLAGESSCGLCCDRQMAASGWVRTTIAALLAEGDADDPG